MGSVIDGKQINSLPLNGRTGILGLMILAPGVQKATINPMVAGGAWFGAANMTVDGAANIDVGNERILPLAPSLESIAEFKVIANGGSAEFGRGGSQVVVVSKSGTNEFHGSLFAFNRNRVLYGEARVCDSPSEAAVQQKRIRRLSGRADRPQQAVLFRQL